MVHSHVQWKNEIYMWKIHKKRHWKENGSFIINKSSLLGEKSYKISSVKNKQANSSQQPNEHEICSRWDGYF